MFVQSYHLIRDKREELLTPRVGIYKRKQESKKRKRKHALDQESDQENDQEKKGLN